MSLTLESLASLAPVATGLVEPSCSSEPQHQLFAHWSDGQVPDTQELGGPHGTRCAMPGPQCSVTGALVSGFGTLAPPRLTHIQVVLHRSVQHHQVGKERAQVGDGALDDTL